MTATKQYLEKHGKPVAFYTDKHSVFRVNHAENKDKNKLTQYGRALKELNIELICANTPQAKGRVERANKTLQDRLVKEMRLAGINSIEQANAWLETFIADHNAKFAVLPALEKDLHRPLIETQNELYDIFSFQSARVLTKSLTLQYDKVMYLLEATPATEKLIGKKVMIHDYPDGKINIKHCGKPLPYSIFDKLQNIRQGEIVENKRLGAVLKFALQEQERLEKEGKRNRSKSVPKRKEQLRQAQMKRC